MSGKDLISRMSDECLMKQETVVSFYIDCQAVMRKFTLAGKTKEFWGLGSYNTGGLPAFYAGVTKVYNNNVEEVSLSSTESSNSDDNTTTLQSKIECKDTTNY